MLKGTQRRLVVGGLALTTLASVALVELPTAAPAAGFPPGHKVFTFNYKVVATTRIAKLKKAFSPPVGTYKGAIDLVTGQLKGGIKLPAIVPGSAPGPVGRHRGDHASEAGHRSPRRVQLEGERGDDVRHAHRHRLRTVGERRAGGCAATAHAPTAHASDPPGPASDTPRNAPDTPDAHAPEPSRNPARNAAGEPGRQVVRIREADHARPASGVARPVRPRVRSSPGSSRSRSSSVRGCNRVAQPGASGARQHLLGRSDTAVVDTDVPADHAAVVCRSRCLRFP